jgi:hypothetical protein
LVPGRFVTHAPAQVDDLELKSLGLTALPQPPEGTLVKGIALGFQVFES